MKIEEFERFRDALAAGDSDEAIRLLHLHQHLLYRQVRRQLSPHLRRHYDSADCAQSVLFGFFQQLNKSSQLSFNSAASFWAYVKVTVRNKLVNASKCAAKREANIPFDAELIPAEDPTKVSVPEALTHSPSFDVVRSIHQLRSEGLTWEEIGKRMGQNKDACRMQYDRLRKSLSSQFRNHRS